MRNHVDVLAGSILAAAIASMQLLAQSPSFEVASVKVNGPDAPKGQPSMTITPAGILYTNVSFSDCLQTAYGVRPFQISGPDWMRSERYTVNARTGGTTGADQIRLMLQRLLADRFALSLHREKKELPVFALIVGKNGPKLTAGDGNGQRRVELLAGAFVMTNTTIPELVEFLSTIPSLGRPVLDKTGIEGRFNITVRMPPGQGDESPETTKRALAAGDPSVIGDAMEEVGLKLDSRRESIDMLVVDRANRVPIED